MRVSQDTVSWDNHELSESRGTRNRQSSIVCAASNIISALKLWNQNIRFCFDSGHFWSTELSILNLYRLMVSILSNFHCLIFSLLLNFALGWNKELRYKVAIILTYIQRFFVVIIKWRKNYCINHWLFAAIAFS